MPNSYNLEKVIVTTTINRPTDALLKYCEKTRLEGWCLVVVGDTKTPHEEYRSLERSFSGVVYLDPEDQRKLYPELSEILGWKTIQRRNIGYVFAYDKGAKIVASVDDDNIPYASWGKNLLIGQEVEYDCYTSDLGVFDPLSVTKNSHVWHRGYPIELVPERHKVKYAGKKTKKVLVQADLWDGDPDIDAIARLSIMPCVRFDDVKTPYGSEQMSPFNTQNTFFDRSVIPYFSVLPFVGRMDDIWSSYMLQHFFPNCVIYCPSSVFQERNVQDLTKNLENEILGYRKTLSLVQDTKNFLIYLPDETVRFWKAYRSQFGDKT
jgi:hypothetical protein